ncbi:MAG: Gfo/Idh/MocA family protein [Acidobacteriota bacterium]
MKWGLIGCGDIAVKRVAPALRDQKESEFVAVCRAQPEKAEEFARRFGARKWFDQWEDLIAEPEIDAVYIATPVYLHAPQALAAAQAGKHVLCEKPMALDVAQCDQIIEACRANGVRLAVAYYRHFYPVIARIKEIIASGEIGRPVLAQVNAFEYLDMPEEHPRRWFLEREKSGGGPMFDFGCHRIEVLLDLFGPARRIASTIGNALFYRDVEDTAVACIEFESRIQASLAVTHGAFESQDTLDIYGNEGSVHVSKLNEGALTINTAGGERREFHPPHPNLHQPLIDDFSRAVLEGRQPLVSGEIGRQVAEVEEAIYKNFAAVSDSEILKP